MIKHNTILVPTDFSEQSSESLRRAAVLHIEEFVGATVERVVALLRVRYW